jgi:outer membrane lipoprotein carrier protein
VGWIAAFWFLGSIAGAADPGPIVARIEARYAKVATLTASFTQTVHSAIYGDDVQSGTIAIARPGRMRWDFTGDGRIFVSDGTTMWIYTPAAKQALKYPYTPTGANGLLQSLDRVGELFDVTAPDPQPAHGVLVDLAPKQADGQVSKIRLTLSSDLSLQQLDLVDPTGAATSLVFSAVKLDAIVPESTFAFVPPAGTAVVDGAP